MVECVIISVLGLNDLEEIIIIEEELQFNGWTLNNFKDEFLKNNSIIIGLKQGEELVGYCFANLIKPELHLLNIAVKKEKQGLGYGLALLKKLLEIAKINKVETIFLELRADNIKALSLYKKFGFQEDGRRKNYYANGIEAILMSLNLLIVGDEKNG